MFQLLIVGATGVLGRATAKLFLKSHYTINGMVRSPDKAEDLNDLGA
jgi:uncharacterized protein YbjT (DUF2867 family)